MYYVYRFYYRLMHFLLWDLVLHIVWSLASSNNIYACTVWHHFFFCIEHLWIIVIIYGIVIRQSECIFYYHGLHRVVMRLICVYVTSWGMTYIVHNGY